MRRILLEGLIVVFFLINVFVLDCLLYFCWEFKYEDCLFGDFFGYYDFVGDVMVCVWRLVESERFGINV